MRVVLVGQKWLAVQLLERCRTLGIEIVLVVVPAPVDGQPDSLERAAAAQGLAVCQTGWRLGAEQVPPCDLVLAAHAHAYIDAGARGQARLGALGFHPSLLPRHRGRDAVRWAVHMREAVTGGSLYWMDDGADTGPVVAQSWCHIRPDDTPTTLWRRELAPMDGTCSTRCWPDCWRGSGAKAWLRTRRWRHGSRRGRVSGWAFVPAKILLDMVQTAARRIIALSRRYFSRAASTRTSTPLARLSKNWRSGLSNEARPKPLLP